MYTHWRGRPLPTKDRPATAEDKARHMRIDQALTILESALGLSDDPIAEQRLRRSCRRGHPWRDEPTNVRLDLDTGTFHCRACEETGATDTGANGVEVGAESTPQPEPVTLDLADVPLNRVTDPQARAEVEERKRHRVEGHCINGHRYDPDDPTLAYTHPRTGQRTCRECRREAGRRSHARKLAAQATQAMPERELIAA